MHLKLSHQDGFLGEDGSSTAMKPGLGVVKICNAYLEHSRRLWKSQETNFAMNENKASFGCWY